ncbi:MAG: signal peptide peptidase SppA [Actinomycetes bacterium]
MTDRRWEAVDRRRAAARRVALSALVLAALVGLALVVRVLASPPGLAATAGVAAVAVGVARTLARRLPDELVLDLDLTTPPVEAHDGPPLQRLVGAGGPPLLRDVVTTLRRAAADDRVRAVVVRLGGQPGLATVQELADALAEARAGGVRTVAVADTLGEFGGGTLLTTLAAACDEVVVQPGAEVALTGLVARLPFARELVDRLGLVPRVGTRHEYKQAASVVTDADLTEPHREATGRLLADRARQVVEAIAAGRGLDEADVRAAVDTGPHTVDEALALGLVDRVAWRDEVLDELTGDGEGPVLVPADAYRRRTSRRPPGAPRGRRRGPRSRRRVVGLVVATGTVARGRSTPTLGGGTTMGADDVVDALRAAERDEHVAAVVVRVDSRGGSAVASASIHRAVVRCRAAGTPVVVSMGEVAASGGYYMAAGADRIVAQPGTITGSIGVVAGKLVTAGAWERLGVRWVHLREGEHAGITAPELDLSPGEQARFDALLDHVYADFTGRVAEGRGMTEAEVDAVARGRVWTGADAHARGLVDELGGLTRAVALAAELAGLDPDPRVAVVDGAPQDAAARLRRRLGALAGVPATLAWLAGVGRVGRTALEPVLAATGLDGLPLDGRDPAGLAPRGVLHLPVSLLPD